MEKGFEQLVSWKKARLLNREIYAVTCRDPFNGDIGLRDQLRRASVSVSSNIAEGYGRGSRKEFIYFLKIALSSCYEIKSQLYIAIDIDYIKKDTFKVLYEHCDEISRTVYGLIKHLENKAH